MALLLVVIFLSITIWQLVAARRAAARVTSAPVAGAAPAVVGFVSWALAGLLAAVALGGILSIGLVIAPIAVAALWVSARTSPRLPTIFGLFAGVGTFLLVLAVIGGSGGPGRATWSLIGVGCVAAGVAGYLLLRRPHGSAGTGRPGD